jgi:hypothetical protein
VILSQEVLHNVEALITSGSVHRIAFYNKSLAYILVALVVVV